MQSCEAENGAGGGAVSDARVIRRTALEQTLRSLQKRPNRRVAAAVLLSHAEVAQRGAVGGSAVALVRREAVTGKLGVQLAHQPVALSLGNQTGGSHAVAQGVGFGGRTQRQLGSQAQVIGHQRLRRRLQPGNRPQRGGVGGAQHVQSVDFFRPGVFHRVAHGDPAHLGGVLLTRRRTQLLAVTKGVVLRGAGQNHRRHRQRPRPRAAPGLVYARHPEVPAPPVFALISPIRSGGRDGHGGQHSGRARQAGGPHSHVWREKPYHLRWLVARPPRRPGSDPGPAQQGDNTT